MGSRSTPGIYDRCYIPTMSYASSVKMVFFILVLNSYLVFEISLSSKPPLCLMKPFLTLICLNFFIKLLKLLKIILLTLLQKNKLQIFAKIFSFFLLFGAPARSRTQNLLVRSQALYPIELQALNIIYSFNIYY